MEHETKIATSESDGVARAKQSLSTDELDTEATLRFEEGTLSDDLTLFRLAELVAIEFLQDETDREYVHGLAVHDLLTHWYDAIEEIHHGRLYPNLDELVDLGFVQKGSADDRTNAYTITARGRRELEAIRLALGAFGQPDFKALDVDLTGLGPEPEPEAEAGD